MKMTNYDKIISQITVERLAELMITSDVEYLDDATMCKRCEAETKEAYCKNGKCPFVERRDLTIKYLKSDVDNFSFTKFFDENKVQRA